MIIAVAGPYSAPSTEARLKNLAALNAAGASLLLAGHIPVIGVNAALPVVAALPDGVAYHDDIMSISMAAIGACESILVIGESPGANRERDWFIAKGLPVYKALEEVPMAK